MRIASRSLLSMRLVFIVTMVLTAVVCYAQFGGGNGTEASPWQIRTAEHLDNIRDYPGIENSNRFFVQTANIDLSGFLWDEEEQDYINNGEGWIPIGTLWPEGVQNREFYGNYDGSGHTIEGLYINRTGQDGRYQGLFGAVRDGTIKNLGLIDVEVSGFAYTGGLAGGIFGSTVEHCYTAGEVTATNTIAGSLIGRSASGSMITGCYSTAEVTGGFNYTGGLVAINEDESTIRYSYSSGTVNGGQYTGGIAGINRNNSRISNCYSISNVPGQWGNNGGIAGRNENNSSIRNSYSRGDVSGTMGHVGGFVGVNSGSAIVNCYSTGRIGAGLSRGGLVGHNMNDGTVTNSYWDRDLTELNTSAGGEPRSTGQMTFEYDLETTFINWDFDDTWSPDINHNLNDGYPVLHFPHAERPDTPEVTISIAVIDGEKYVVISWNNVEDALSYRIYSSDNPYTVNWGLPAAIVEETEFSERIEDNVMRFYRVTASAEAAP